MSFTLYVYGVKKKKRIHSYKLYVVSPIVLYNLHRQESPQALARKERRSLRAGGLPGPGSAEREHRGAHALQHGLPWVRASDALLGAMSVSGAVCE